jgi:putative Holliday junction resolvase
VRVIALDIGEKRIGVAVSDPTGTVATPLAVVDTGPALANGDKLMRIVKDYEPELVVVGLPLSMDGTEGAQARRVRDTAKRLARFLPERVEFIDERLSSVEASRRMREAGHDARQQRGSVDMVAASIFLQEYLDARTASESEGDRTQ